MGGHVNMMDDVLISNLPPEYLRSVLRALVSQGSIVQQPFVQHIRQRFTDTPPELYQPKQLFSEPDIVTSECKRFLALTRCVFSCKMALQSLVYLEHFVTSIQCATATWSDGSELEAALEKFGGDIVQAVQALKESKPEKSSDLEKRLLALISALRNCKSYCENASPKPLTYPFSRAERQVVDVLGFIFPGRQTATSEDGGISSERTIQIPMDAAVSSVEHFQLGPFTMPRLFNGLWQLSSPAWGSGTAEKQEIALTGLVQAGFVATDMADHYGDAELVYGDFRNRLTDEYRNQVYAATKWCVFSPIKRSVTPEWVLGCVKERCKRLGGRVELLQFHWYDYEAKEYLDVLLELVGITKSHPELVGTIGLCNFDSEHTREACDYLLSKTGSVGIVSNQVQFSLFDSRPLKEMCAVCDKFGLKLLTYGSFCGGFLSSKWLGQEAPEIYSETAQLTPSQRKYFDMICNWGTWSEFQGLLSTLSLIAKKYGVSLTNVATRWVLQQPAVGAVIVGTQLGVSAHGDENLAVFKFKLDNADIQLINEKALGDEGQKAAGVFKKLGDCGNEYRAMH
ncbi:aldo/keto reductase [Xylariaceae sp. FL0255]|nr:aldo/keto reductase [Xylariaceae sp. FL0255]